MWYEVVLVVWCDVVWCGVVLCGVVWCEHCDKVVSYGESDARRGLCALV